jgi:hypothetical protein
MSGSAAAISPDGAVVLMPDEFPVTEDGIFDALGKVSEVLGDAEESVANACRMVEDSERLSHLQAGSMMLRAAYYKEVGESIVKWAQRIESSAFDRSLYGPDPLGSA